ncbi:MAG: hypothetical protein ACM3JF_02825 [Sphaerimonospora mesophila]
MSKIKISSRLIADAARARGWTVSYYDDSFSSLVKITPPGRETKIFRSTVTMKDSYVGSSITDNKYETFLVLKDASLPVPDTILYDVETINDFLHTHGQLVIKPASTDHGDGVTVNVCSAEQAVAAFEYAKQYTQKERDIIVQCQLAGSDHRLLVVGDSVFVARRQKPTVTGDGSHTIRELVAIKNEDPKRAEGHLAPLSRIDIQKVEQFLEESVDVVPTAGQTITILGTSNLSTGGEAVELTAIAHDSFKDMARRAARMLGLRVCAIDVMCTDITLPVDSQETGIIEMNVVPGIRMHHFPSEGKPVDAAGAILDEVFDGE